MRRKIIALLLILSLMLSLAGCSGGFGGLGGSTGEVYFSGKDIRGTDVSLSDYAGASVIMINFWAPWCGPCVREMPDLQLLYTNHRLDGLVIIGVYTSGDVSDVYNVVTGSGITYPIIEMPDSLEPYMTNSIPTTIFIDSNGNLLSSEPYVGSKSYSEWNSIVTSYLERDLK